MIAIVGAAGSGRHTLAAQIERHWVGAAPQWQVLSADEARVLWAEHDAVGGAIPDAVVLAASAEQGLDGALAAVWERWAERQVPRIVALTHLDVGRVDDDELRLICEAVLGEPIVAMTLPLADDDEDIAGTLDLIHGQISDDQTATSRPADAEHIAFSLTARTLLEEAVLSWTEDDALVEASLLGLSISPERLSEELITLTRAGLVAPAFVATTPHTPRHAVGFAPLAQFLQRVLSTN